jgi:hypothetical protein
MTDGKPLERPRKTPVKKPPPVGYSLRLSPKAAAALGAISQNAGISRTRALTDLVELRLAGTRASWLENRFGIDGAGVAAGAALEDRIAGRMVEALEAGLDRKFKQLRVGVLQDLMMATKWAVEGPDENTPAWALPYAGNVGEAIGKAFLTMLRYELGEGSLGQGFRETNLLAALSVVQSSVAAQLATHQVNKTSVLRPGHQPEGTARAAKAATREAHAIRNLVMDQAAFEAAYDLAPEEN